MKIEIIKKRLALKEELLAQAYEAYAALLSGGVQSYTIGSRNLTRLNLPDLEETIAKLENEISELESLLDGGSRRRAVRVLPRDL